MGDLQLFLQHLKQPEYIHVLLNPMPIYGMAAGAFVLLVSLMRRKDSLGALLWLILMSVATWFVIHYGHRGYDRVFAMSNTDVQQWLDVHMHRAETWMFVFYLTGAAAFVALLTKKRWPAAAQGLCVAALLLAILSTALGGWIAQAGGQIRHSEFREGPPRPDQLPSPEEQHHHSHEHEEKDKDSRP